MFTHAGLHSRSPAWVGTRSLGARRRPTHRLLFRVATAVVHAVVRRPAGGAFGAAGAAVTATDDLAALLCCVERNC